MSALAELQRAFAAHVRDPVLPAPAAIEPRRMRIYRELVYNTVEGFAAGGFPVLRSLFDDASWHAMVGRFVAAHRCHTPYFLRISEEFLAFLQREEASLGLPPFACELAHYEWVELALDVAEDEVPAAVTAAELLDGVPRLGPLAWPLAYRWPVHRIGRDYQPSEAPAQPTCLIVYRDRADAVKFIETNALTLRLLELLEPGELCGRSALAALAAELGGAAAPAIDAAGARILDQLGGIGVLRL